MTPQTLKMLMMFFLAAVLLNLTNYLFCWLYDPPSHKAIKIHPKLSHPSFRSFVARNHVTRAVNWSQALICNENGTCKNSTKSGETDKSSSVEIQMLYHQYQSTDTNGDYYYNDRMGPVMCPEIPPGLGPIKPEDLVNLEAIDGLYSILQPGGFYREWDCTPRQTVAIIIPYEGPKSQLTEFLYSIHPVLLKQQLEYQIFVVKTQDNKTQPLNRGKLFNIGFTEAQRMKTNGGWQCVVFHQHDLVPTNTRNLYRCGERPLQLVLSLTTNQSYESQFGGAITMKPCQFLKANGFSNLYVGNDAVYDDLAKRLFNANITIDQNNVTTAKYARLPSTRNEEIIKNNQSIMLQTTSTLYLLDGLSTLTYTVNRIEMKPLYTLIVVNLDKGVYRIGNASDMLWDSILNLAISD